MSKKLTYAANRTPELLDRFTDPSTRLMVAADLALIDGYDTQIAELERHLVKHAQVDDPVTFGLLRTIPGIGPILGLTLLYEIDDIKRFPEAGNFLSYSRLVRCEHTSAGKVKGSGPKKIGNAHLKWAFSEAACLMIRAVPAVKGWMQRQEKKRGKRKALAVLEAKIGRSRVPPVAQAGAVRREAVPEGLSDPKTKTKTPGEEKRHERSLMGGPPARSGELHAELGHHGDRVRVTFVWDSIPAVALRHTPDPVATGLAPGPVTGWTTRSTPTRTGVAWVRRGRPMRPDDRVND